MSALTADECTRLADAMQLVCPSFDDRVAAARALRNLAAGIRNLDGMIRWAGDDEEDDAARYAKELHAILTTGQKP